MLFLFRASLISVGLAAVVVPTRLAAIEPWPGEPNSTALVLPLFLVDGSVAVEGLPTAVTPGLEPPGVGYEYRSFRLVGSNGLGGRGFLRVGVTLP